MRLSPLGYYADFFISLALIAGLAFAALIEGTLHQGMQWVVCFLSGFLVWTFLEYLVHRVLYHSVPYFEELHDAHHAEPNAYIGAPPIIGIVLLLLLFFVPALAISFVAASGVTSGVLAGYMAYMLIHHAAHYWNLPPSSWLYRLRRHHALHHHRDDHGNYGITTSFWDYVFGTSLERRRRVSRYELP
jgi:sterol desaturase/sphingolipid hydroxylase (fatty acid hydroxylase superfamily)